MSRRLDMTKQKKKFASQITIPRRARGPTLGDFIDAPIMYLPIDWYPFAVPIDESAMHITIPKQERNGEVPCRML